jgi:hypothetical protein
LFKPRNFSRLRHFHRQTTAATTQKTTTITMIITVVLPPSLPPPLPPPSLVERRPVVDGAIVGEALLVSDGWWVGVAVGAVVGDAVQALQKAGQVARVAAVQPRVLNTATHSGGSGPYRHVGVGALVGTTVGMRVGASEG